MSCVNPEIPPRFAYAMIIAAVACGIIAFAYGLFDKARWCRLDEVYDDFEDAIADYSSENDGWLPGSPEELIKGGYLAEMPVNPYTGRRMHVQPAGSEPTHGAIIFETELDPNTGRVWKLSFIIYAIVGRRAAVGQGRLAPRYLEGMGGDSDDRLGMSEEPRSDPPQPHGNEH